MARVWQTPHVAKSLNPVVRTVVSIWAWLVLGVAMLVALPVVGLIWLATAWRDPGRYLAGRVFRQVAVVMQKLNPLWAFSVSGKVPDDPRRPYMVVANHESFVDILLIAHLPFEMKWVAKSDFFSYPVIGWLMQMVGDIKLVRSSPGSRMAVLDQMADRLNKKVAVMVFPEGTRSRDGDLGRFRDGAFRVAQQAGVPVLPLAVLGTRDALVKHDWRFGVSHAEVRVLEPIPYDPDRTVAELRELARAEISAALEEMRAERVGASA